MLLGACSDRSSARRKSTEPAKAPPTVTPSGGPIQTGKQPLQIPGRAFVDGRDLEATPPLTVMKVNVWDAVPRQQTVCQLSHGEAVELLSARRDDGEDRYYVRVRSRRCEGWLPESFLSPKSEAVVGDRN
jgi:hypothetical protein